MKLFKRLLRHGASFLGGCISMLVLSAIFVETHPGKATKELLKAWGASYDVKSAVLTVPLPDKSLVARFRADPNNTSEMTSDIEILKRHVGAVFTYTTSGETGAPSAEYSEGRMEVGHVWRDLDTDGRLDVHIDIAANERSIRLGDLWIPVKKVSGLEATFESDSKYVFDGKDGEWHKTQVSGNLGTP